MYIGIDLGGTNIAAGLVDGNGNIIARAGAPTMSSRSPEEIARDMARLADGLAKEAPDEVKGIGIGCPGTIDFKKGEVIYSNNIAMENFPLAEKLGEYTDIPIKIDNDANCAALGEYTASGSGDKSFLLITLGTGVGSGLVINGELYRGFNGAAAEAGHITLVSGGEMCTCGKQGCWEAYASVTALIRDTKRAMEKHPQSLMHEEARREGKVSGKTAFRAAKAGDAAALEVTKNYIRYVADGIVSCENLLQPDTIAIGGGISREGEYLLDPVREYVKKTGFNKYGKKTKITAARLFNDAGIVGAAMLCK